MNMNQTKSNTSRTRSTQILKNSATSQPANYQKAQLNYERYLAQARAAALVGNQVDAENYYQHAEHYFRSIHADSN